MKTTIFALLFLLSFNLYSQRKEVKTFLFEGHKIEYSRIDYSKYGIAHFYITMYSDAPINDMIEKKGVRYLKRQERLYHTLYFFLKIPKEIKTESKSLLFNEFMAHINFEEKIEKYNLYLNFDINYSVPYQLSHKNNNSIDIKKITTSITSSNIWKTL
jgi:hypothetical protein